MHRGTKCLGTPRGAATPAEPHPRPGARWPHLGPTENGINARGDLFWDVAGSKRKGLYTWGQRGRLAGWGASGTQTPPEKPCRYSGLGASGFLSQDPSPPPGPRTESRGGQHLRVRPDRRVVMNPKDADDTGVSYGIRVSQDEVPTGGTTTLLPMSLPAPLGMTRPSGSKTSWVQRREMTVTGGCKRILSLTHMVRKGSWARSSLRDPTTVTQGAKPETPSAFLPLEILSPPHSDSHSYNKINAR